MNLYVLDGHVFRNEPPSKEYPATMQGMGAGVHRAGPLDRLEPASFDKVPFGVWSKFSGD